MPKWLKCKIDKGMFSDEFTVTVHSRAGEAIAVFVPKRSADDQKNLVQVKAFEQQGKIIAVLPDEHQSVIDVNAGDLQPA
jgi:acyl-CoA thioesterase